MTLLIKATDTQRRIGALNVIQLEHADRRNWSRNGNPGSAMFDASTLSNEDNFAAAADFVRCHDTGAAG